MVLKGHLEKLYMCPYCSHTFAIEHNMKMHSIACKKGQGQNGNIKQECVICGETYENEDEHLPICSQRGKSKYKENSKKIMQILWESISQYYPT